MKRAIVLALLVACSGGDNATSDAGVCEPTPDRNVSCRNICRADVELCAGVVDWTICFEECRAGVADVAWCPGQVP